jgi:hypothetical protein
LSDPSIYRTSPATNNSSLFTAPSRRKISRRDRLLLELYGRFSTIARKKRSSKSFLTLLTTVGELADARVHLRARPRSPFFAPRDRRRRPQRVH